MTVTPTRLIGRDEVLRRIEGVTSAGGTGGTAVVLTGEAGIGKSVLLAELVRNARAGNAHVLTATGLETETHLPFAGLHQLLHAVLPRADALPLGQRTALLAAFGMTEAGSPEPFLVALAALQLVSDLSDEGPVLVAVDDCQWLDPPTADVLAFVARRIQHDPVTMVLVVRAGHETPVQRAVVDQVELGPLDDRSAGELVDGVAAGLDEAVRERVLREAAGNPLALVELPTVLLADGVQASGRPQVPLPTRLEAAFTARLAKLPSETRLVALVAAADDGDSVVEVVAASAALVGSEGTAEQLIGDLVAADLLRIDQRRFRFRHPLVRSATYSSAQQTLRSRAHSALAAALLDDPDRRAWHLAAAATRPDEQVAEEVERAARRAASRGARALTLSALERAAELSPGRSKRSERKLRAAELAVELGLPARAAALLADIEPGCLQPVDQARLALTAHMVDPGAPGDASKVLALVSSGRSLAREHHTDLAMSFTLAAALAAWWADPGDSTRQAVVSGAEDLGAPADDPRLLAIYGYVDPEGHAATIIDRAAAVSPASVDPSSATMIGTALNVAGAFDLSAGFQDAAVAGLRARGNLGRLPEALTQQAWTGIHMMRWDVALPALDEAVRLAEETGQPLWRAAAVTGQAMHAALRGDLDAAQRLAADAEATALPLGAGAVLCGVQLARGVAALGAGLYADAYASLRRVLDPADPSHHHFQSLWVLGDLAEAAVHSGNSGEMTEILRSFDDPGREVRSPWARIGLAYGRPLLAPDEEAGAMFRAALGGDLVRWPAYRARLLLEFGAWARRRHDNQTARTQLRAAREACDALGLLPWAERARQELRAAGERSGAPPADVWARLSPQEMQIARLAATGLSNREIGQRLFLSPRTIGSHLYRIFPKLGISSRAALGRYLSSEEAPGTVPRQPSG